MHDIPTRFRPDPRKKGEAWRLRLVLGKKNLPTDEQINRFGELMMKGDPLDDQLADWGANIGFAQARLLIDKALEQGIEHVPEAPDFLRDLFVTIDNDPPWLDRKLMEDGQRAVCRTGVVGTLVMRDAALMGGYGNAAINKPLVFTGALAQSAARRTSETRAFAIDVTKPGAMDRFGKGVKTTVKVRFLHALLRRRIRKHPDWRDKDWGIPINQADMLATNIVFSVGFLTGMKALGFRFSQREKSGIIHLWKYLGYLMGIDENILVDTEREGLKILYASVISQPDADEDTRTLARALMNEPYEMAGNDRLSKLWAEAQVRMHNGVTHFFVGSASYRNLGLPENRRWTWVPLAVFPLVFTAETVRQLMPNGDEFFSRIGMAWRTKWIEDLLKNQPAAYRPVDILARDQQSGKRSEG
jgi:hypothetical protein